MSKPIIERRTERSGEWVTRNVSHTYDELLNLFPDDNSLVNPLVCRCQELEDILRRIKQHWADGVTPTEEANGDWFGTMREILDEFRDDPEG